jgi:hypothetical protein
MKGPRTVVKDRSMRELGNWDKDPDKRALNNVAMVPNRLVVCCNKRVLGIVFEDIVSLWGRMYLDH